MLDSLIIFLVVLEPSHLKLYLTFNQAERSYAALKTGPNVLSFTAAGHAGATGEICICSGA